MEQVAIVTGGASGIGLALGTALVQRGWHVVLADLQDVAAKEHADRLTRPWPGLGRRGARRRPRRRRRHPTGRVDPR